MALLSIINFNHLPIAKNIKITLAVGLLVSSILVSIIGLTFWQSLNTLHQQLEHIVEESDVKTNLVYDMRIAARERNLRLMMIVIKNDPFAVDEEWMTFRDQGGIFLNAREKLLKMNLQKQELDLLERQRELSRIAVVMQYEIYNNIMEEDDESAMLLFYKHLDAQEKVFIVLDELLLIQKKNTATDVSEARVTQLAALKKIVVLCTVVVLLIFIITALTIRRLSQQAMHIENEALKFKALIEGSMDAVLMLDNHEVIDCNINSLQMFGVASLGELNQKGLDYFSRVSNENDSDEDLFAAINHVLVDSKQRYQWVFCNVKHKEFPVDVELTGLELEGKRYVQMVIRDVTEREKHQQELRDANENLEIKVQERTAELKELNSKMVGIARSAGMAEVASGVLHNVGNVLNSVNVSTSMLRSQAENWKAGNLAKIAEMMKSNKDDICDFMENDEKGKVIIPYLEGLSGKMKSDQQKHIEEINCLADNVDHIKNIISMQQSYTGSMGVIETLKSSSIIEDAIKINISSIENHNIVLSRKYEDDPEISVDKHKLIQVMVNLISNAKYAVLNNEDDNREITIGIRQNSSKVVLYVEDNGVGINEKDIGRLFEFGYKKREGGHGYGLHHSALVLKELRGGIDVESKGPGYGSKFEINIPVE